MKTQRNAFRTPGDAEPFVLVIFTFFFPQLFTKVDDDVAPFDAAVTRAIIH